MTMEIDREKVASHLKGILADPEKERVLAAIQPKLPAEYLLLCGNYLQGDTHIDLYGTYDVHTDEVEVMDFTLTGSRVPLWDLQPAGSNILAELTEWINEGMPSRAQLRAEGKWDAAIERCEERKNES